MGLGRDIRRSASHPFDQLERGFPFASLHCLQVSNGNGFDVSAEVPIWELVGGLII